MRRSGASTGKADFFVDFIGSKDVAQIVGSRRAMPATSGAASRTASTRRAARSGGAAGSGFPTRSPVRIYTELNGVDRCPTTWRAGRRRSLVGVDGIDRAAAGRDESMTRVHVGVNYQHRRGFFIGTGLAWNLPKEERIEAFVGRQRQAVRRLLGLAGADRVSPRACGCMCRRRRPPPPPPPPAPAAVHNLTVKADCDPCTVQVGPELDGDGDGAELRSACAVTYRWTRAERHVCEPDGPADAVDGGAAGRRRCR